MTPSVVTSQNGSFNHVPHVTSYLDLFNSPTHSGPGPMFKQNCCKVNQRLVMTVDVMTKIQHREIAPGSFVSHHDISCRDHLILHNLEFTTHVLHMTRTPPTCELLLRIEASFVRMLLHDLSCRDHTFFTFTK